MKLLDKNIFFTRDKIRKTCLENHPSPIFEITLIQTHFTKTTLGFSIITKIPFLLVLYFFLKASHKHSQAHASH
jgi:hypothetical protein